MSKDLIDTISNILTERKHSGADKFRVEFDGEGVATVRANSVDQAIKRAAKELKLSNMAVKSIDKQNGIRALPVNEETEDTNLDYERDDLDERNKKGNRRKDAPKQRNPLALATRQMGKRVVPDKTKYNRKKMGKAMAEDFIEEQWLKDGYMVSMFDIKAALKRHGMNEMEIKKIQAMIDQEKKKRRSK